MIGYTMVGTKDLEKSLRFYDPLFAEMGLDQCWRDEQSASWGDKSDETVPRFFTGYPYDGLSGGRCRYHRSPACAGDAQWWLR